jgi:hypothetical protein
VLVCDPRKNGLLKVGSKSDRIDSRKLAELLRSDLLRSVYHENAGIRTVKELARSCKTITAKSHSRDGSSESSLPKLGHPLCRSAGLCTIARALGQK